ncbi:MarR family transcriptional regulator [Colletotrichum karsti]|uniref:MarR family transcriptional regulator n=1 Tax=Colletotrichum karsti TaxID=1095194 RepID=A0A9P6I8K3_9PEZI|nr:MarR family transcriptional regulator [Colletotrichum karsti]KAF9878862.1 MarR family transcriptional regulator [Colletotrichum karsti]
MSTSPVTYRTHRPGDIGWITYRHGILYFQEHAWDERFEAYVAKIMSDFILNYNPATDICLIAERDDQFLGCVLVCKESEMKDTARLRVLLVEPTARGLGLGKQLVQRSIEFARERGYCRMVLATQSNLARARSLYKKAGFEFVREEEAGDFAGPDSKGEIWGLQM